MEILAAFTLASWLVLFVIMAAQKGSTTGFHVLVPVILSVALSLAVLLNG